MGNGRHRLSSILYGLALVSVCSLSQALSSCNAIICADNVAISTGGLSPGLLPVPSRLALDIPLDEVLVRMGASIIPDMHCNQHIAIEGNAAVLCSSWLAGADSEELACAVYSFRRIDTPAVMGLETTWETCPANDLVWIGFADFERDTWSWSPSQQLTSTSSLAIIAEANANIGQDGLVICAVVLLGQNSHQLELLNLGTTAPDITAVAPTSGAPDSVVMFNANVIGTEPLSYSWNFHNAAIPSQCLQRQPIVTLNSSGQHPATLSVQNPLGSDVYDFVVEIAPPGVVVITGLTTDKTTHCISGDRDPISGQIIPSHLELTCINYLGAEVEWLAEEGLVEGDVLNATWQPSGEMSPGVVEITAHVDNGLSQDEANIHLRITEAQIRWEAGEDGRPGQYIDFNNLDFLEPLANGGAILPAPNAPFASYFDGTHVVLLTRNSLSLGMSLSQLPLYHAWADTYKVNGFYAVLDWPYDSCNKIKDYLKSPTPPYDVVSPLNLFYCYSGEPREFFWFDLGCDSAAVFAVLFDADGYIRLSQSGDLSNDTQWDRVISQLCASP